MALLTLLPGALPGQARPDTAAARIDSITVTAARAIAAAGGAGVLQVRLATLPFPAPPAAPLGDILREVPFVLVRQNSRGEQEISMRGAESRQAAVLVEGIPVTLGWDGRVDPSLLPLTGVTLVQVTRGLASLASGPNVLGGVIELGYHDPARPGPGRRDLTLASGLDHTGASALSVAGGDRWVTSLGLLTLRAGAGRRQRNGLPLDRNGGLRDGAPGLAPDAGRNGEGALRSNSDLREHNGFAALRLGGGTGRHVGVTLSGFDAERGVPAELHLAEPRLWRIPEARQWLVAASAGTGVGATPFGAGSVDVSLGVTGGTTRIDSYTDPTYATIAASESGDQRTTTLRATASHSLGSGGQLRAGHTRAAVRYDEWFDDDPAARYRQILTSSVVEGEWTFLDGTQVGAGLVHDRAETPESGGREPLGQISKLGWRVGASTPVAGGAVRLHASLHRRARFPSLRELYSGALNRFAPNPALRPEALLGGEVGATVTGGPLARAGFSVQAVAFRHRLEDGVVRITLPDRRFMRVNRHEVRSHGLELVVDWASPTRRRLGTGGWTVSADLLLQRVRVRQPAGPGAPALVEFAEHQPEVRGAVDVGAPFPGGLRAVAGVRLTGRQYCPHPDRGGMVPLDAQATGHAALTREWPAARWRLGSIRAVVALDNLADATAFDQCGLPQPGRTLRIGIEIR